MWTQRRVALGIVATALFLLVAAIFMVAHCSARRLRGRKCLRRQVDSDREERAEEARSEEANLPAGPMVEPAALPQCPGPEELL